MPLVEKRQSSGSAKLVFYVVAIVVAAIAWWFMSRPTNIRSKAVLDEVANKLNQRTPLLVDRDTELTNAMSDEGILTYNYRLVNVSAADVQPDALEQRVKPSATKGACTTPETRDALLEIGVTLRYRYYDKEKSYIGEFEVKAADCH